MQQRRERISEIASIIIVVVFLAVITHLTGINQKVSLKSLHTLAVVEATSYSSSSSTPLYPIFFPRTASESVKIINVARATESGHFARRRRHFLLRPILRIRGGETSAAADTNNKGYGKNSTTTATMDKVDEDLVVSGKITNSREASTSTATLNSMTDNTTMTPMTRKSEMMDGAVTGVNDGSEHPESSSHPIRVLFSDVDGTLVHYPDEDRATTTASSFLPLDKKSDGGSSAAENEIIHLPPSSTGMRGIISTRTLTLCSTLRHQHNIKLVLISGMRSSTLFKRLPYLPRADAYCCEAGGRIFYPVRNKNEDDEKDGADNNNARNKNDIVVVVRPHPYHGANRDDMKTFALVEDMEWRKQRMESMEAAGPDGYSPPSITADDTPVIPFLERRGALWDFARTLTSKGYVIDSRGYSTCFRVNRKQQDANVVGEKEFNDLTSGHVALPDELASSVNLGCVDFYPKASGKKNCCAYLAKHFCGASEDGDAVSVLSKYAVCMCDDDNDLEMALACQHAYVPAVSSTSMARAVLNNRDRITLTEDKAKNMVGTDATEEALRLIMTRIREISTPNTIK